MRISHDYSYLGNDADTLIEKGYAELSIHTLHFDRDFSEEEKEENRRQANILSKDDWSKRCDNFSEYVYNQLKGIVEYFSNNFDCHQISEEKSTTEHYRSDWDLFFYSNRGWNKKEYFDFFTMSFNEMRTAKSNIQLMNKIIDDVKKMEIKNVYCRVQYSLKINEEKLEQDSIKVIESIGDKFVIYNGITGKFKLVNEYGNIKIYGFFPKGSKKKYYSVNNRSVVMELSKAV